MDSVNHADFSVVLFCSSRDNQSLFQELSNIFSEDSNQQSSRELLMKVLHQYLFNFYTITDRFPVCWSAFCHQQVQAHKILISASWWRESDVTSSVKFSANEILICVVRSQ